MEKTTESVEKLLEQFNSHDDGVRGHRFEFVVSRSSYNSKLIEDLMLAWKSAGNKVGEECTKYSDKYIIDISYSQMQWLKNEFNLE